MKLLNKFFGVSVVLTTFNGKSKGFLDEAINSVLNQTYDNYELVIIDDGSKDNTSEYISLNFLHPKVRVITQENSGVSNARNIGIENAKFELIAFLDDDDVWYPQKLAIQVEEFEKFQDIDMNYCAIERVDKHGNFLNFQYHLATSNMYEKLLFSNIVDATSGVIAKKHIFDKIGGFSEIAQGAEDYEMWIRIASKFKISSVEQPLLKYRVHTSNDSKNIEKAMIAIEQMFEKVCAQNKKLDKRSLLFNAYKNLANKAFEIENYDKFQEILKKMVKIDSVGIKLKVKYFLSFFPTFIKFARSFR